MGQNFILWPTYLPFWCRTDFPHYEFSREGVFGTQMVGPGYDAYFNTVTKNTTQLGNSLCTLGRHNSKYDQIIWLGLCVHEYHLLVTRILSNRNISESHATAKT